MPARCGLSPVAYYREMTPCNWAVLLFVVGVLATAPPVLSAGALGFADLQAWYGVLLGFVGLAYVTHRQLKFSQAEAQKRTDVERAGLIRVLYFEVYNRAVRCALDASTWRDLVAKDDKITLSRFRKFRPTDPAVMQQSAGKLALLPADVLAPLMMFYFMLDAVRRDVEKDPDMGSSSHMASGEMKLFARRLHQTIAPAIQVLDALGDHLGDREGDDRELEAAHADFIDDLPGEDLQAILANVATLSPP